MLRQAFTLLAVAGAALAQRPSNMTMCDYYAMQYWNATENLAINQYNLLNVIMNRFAFGRYTMADGTVPPGFMEPSQLDGKPVNLLPYFNGGLASTNQNGPKGVSVKFLTLMSDGVYPPPQNFSSTGINANQNIHLVHGYPYFGTVLGCSKIGEPDFPAYTGPASVYEVHKYMNLDPLEVSYFINQIGLACKSVGFTEADVALANSTFDAKFNVRCHPPEKIIEHQGLQYNSICSSLECPVADSPICPAINVSEPEYVNFTTSMGLGSGQCTDNCSGIGTEFYNFTNTTTPMCYANKQGNCLKPIGLARHLVPQ